MANYYVSSVAWAAVTAWSASVAVTLGTYKRQTAPAFGSERVFKCTTAGTSGATEPTWSLNNNATTADGTVTWTQVAGQEAEQAAGNWKAPHGTIQGALSAFTAAAGDVVFVSSDHVEAATANWSRSGNNYSIISVSRVGASLPPTQTDVSTTPSATIQTTGTFSITLSGNIYWHGFKFNAGIGSSAQANVVFGAALSTFHTCEFGIATTHVNSSSGISLNSSNTSTGTVNWTNSSVKFQNSTQRIQNSFAELNWRDSPAPIGGVAPAILCGYSTTNGVDGTYNLDSLDLSSFTGIIASVNGRGFVTARNCKLNAAATLSQSFSAPSFVNRVRFHNCDDNTSDVGIQLREDNPTNVMQSTSEVYRNSGATDGVTHYSVRQLSGTNAQLTVNEARFPRVNKRVNDIGVAKTFTLEALFMVTGALTMPTGSLASVRFGVLSDASSPVAVPYNTPTGLLDATALTASTEAWDNGLAARTNSANPAAGTLFKVASNPGRVFRKTSGGVLAASEPAAYATAVDGDQITDGSAVIHVCVRVKFAVTATPARKGVVTADVNIKRPNGAIVWIDPKITVS